MGGRRRLRADVPRAFRDHRTPEARRYSHDCRSLLEELGGLPRSAMLMLRDWGLLVSDEIPKLTEAYRRARTDQRKRLAHRRLSAARQQADRMRQRLEGIAARQPRSIEDALRKASGL